MAALIALSLTIVTDITLRSDSDATAKAANEPF